jgi:N-acetylated-alpha-linked acidic dipeptidase
MCLFFSGSALLAQDLPVPQSVFGFRDFTQQAAIDRQFLAVPDAKLAGEELKTLTAAPHIAGSKEDYATAEYVASKFKAAGLDTTIVPYRVLLNLPVKVLVQASGPDGKLLMTGPTKEHVQGDPFQDDPRVVPAFNGSSASGDATAGVVYANYGQPEDFRKLDELHISVKGKIVLARYGANFRGVKAYLAEKRGAAGLLIYSDPADDGYYKGDKYPQGPYRPDTGVQRGSIGYIMKYPGDAMTPGFASTMDLPDAQRVDPSRAEAQPKIIATPISYHDAAPILEHIGGPDAPRSWQGALPFTYHVGGNDAVKVHLMLKQDYEIKTIWDVIGKVRGTDFPDDWVVAGNHRDAWVYGAADPSSGTAVMLETVHGLGELLKTGWKPKRTIVFGSWDAEEEGLIGSTEWVEQNASELNRAVAYFNTDVGDCGPDFTAAAVPSLKQFIRELTKEVASPKGGSVYDVWKAEHKPSRAGSAAAAENPASTNTAAVNKTGKTDAAKSAKEEDVEIGDLGSGSDFTPFLQHLGVPSSDIASTGPYGVYHSVFDNYAWFLQNADPTFVYEQQQARVFGLEVLHMADTDVLPYDYQTYGSEIEIYLRTAQSRAAASPLRGLKFDEATTAAMRFTSAGATVRAQQLAPINATALNTSLRAAEAALLLPEGLPNRAWYKHSIYAPGEYTGYAAVVVPGVSESIDAATDDGTGVPAAGAAKQAQLEIGALADALNRAAALLEAATAAPRPGAK